MRCLVACLANSNHDVRAMTKAPRRTKIWTIPAQKSGSRTSLRQKKFCWTLTKGNGKSCLLPLRCSLLRCHIIAATTNTAVAMMMRAAMPRISSHHLAAAAACQDKIFSLFCSATCFFTLEGVASTALKIVIGWMMFLILDTCTVTTSIITRPRLLWTKLLQPMPSSTRQLPQPCDSSCCHYMFAKCLASHRSHETSDRVCRLFPSIQCHRRAFYSFVEDLMLLNLCCAIAQLDPMNAHTWES